MTFQEQVKKNRPTLIKVTLMVGIAWYLSSKYKIVPRESFNGVCDLIGGLRERGYIELVGPGTVRIVEGLK